MSTSHPAPDAPGLRQAADAAASACLADVAALCRVES